ncbi:hypothetical protein TNCV_2164081 [Trichonephila clavipes]|nr:hypothetical protein TNCV_2164081 [Trichonephila clavipes]
MDLGFLVRKDMVVKTGFRSEAAPQGSPPLGEYGFHAPEVPSDLFLLPRGLLPLSCGRPGLSGMKLCLMFFTLGMMTQRTAPGKLALGAGF